MEVMEINSNQEAEALADGEEESPTDRPSAEMQHGGTANLSLLILIWKYRL